MPLYPLVIALAIPYLIYPISMVQVYLVQRQNRLKVTAIANGAQVSIDNISCAVLALCGFGIWSVIIPKLIMAPLWVIFFRSVESWRPNNEKSNQSHNDILAFSLHVLGVELCATAINSILNQTFRDFELIIVDDQSPDSSIQICETFQDPKIRIVHQHNQGLAGARNTGIHHAKGKYIALLDADNYWSPEKLERHIAHLENNPKIGVSYCPSIFVDDDGISLGIKQSPKLKQISSKIFSAEIRWVTVRHPCFVKKSSTTLPLTGSVTTLPEIGILTRRLNNQKTLNVG